MDRLEDTEMVVEDDMPKMLELGVVLVDVEEVLGIVPGDSSTANAVSGPAPT